MAETLVEMRHVSKIFPRTLLLKRRGKGSALEDVSLDAKAGEVVALLGENGAGKTTLLKIAATLITPTAGEVYIEGVDAIRNDRDARGRVSFTTNTERSFYYRLDGWSNLRFFCGLYGMGMKEIRENIEPYLDALSMREALDMSYMYMSTGMRRKLALLRSLALRRRILLLDEPASNMDPVSARQVASMISELRRKGDCTVILSTNNLEDAEILANRVVILKKGRVVLSSPLRPRELRKGTVEIVVERSAHMDTSRILSGAMEIPVENGIKFTMESEDAVAELNHAIDELRAEGIRIISTGISSNRVQQLIDRTQAEGKHEFSV